MACSVNFEKKSIVFISGASKGIGQSLAINLARQLNQSSIFVLMARSADGLEKTKNDIAEIDKCICVLTFVIDLSKPDNDLFGKIFDEILNKIDSQQIEFGLFFHNAGHVGVLKQTTDLTDLNAWRNYYDLNLFSVILLNSLFVKKIRPIAPQLVVVNITSLCGRVPFKDLAMYGSGKAAREQFFRVFALEEPRIVVLNYSPGPVSTDMFHSIVKEAQSEDVRKDFQEVADKSVLQPEQTVDKLIEILKKGEFQNGATVDYFDRI